MTVTVSGAATVAAVESIGKAPETRSGAVTVTLPLALTRAPMVLPTVAVSAI